MLMLKPLKGNIMITNTDSVFIVNLNILVMLNKETLRNMLILLVCVKLLAVTLKLKDIDCCILN